MAFLDGIKNSLKLDEMASGMASKLNSAKTFVQNQQQNVGEIGAVKMVRDKVSSMVPQNIGNYFGPLAKHVPGAKGNKQSPIDIVASQAVYDESLGDGQFRFNYHPDDFIELVNTGNSWQINLKKDSQSTVEAVHLDGTYKLKQIHCHWGSEPMNGSEHTVGGVGYAGELHFVHWKVQYGTYEEASKHNDGLAVIGVFLNETHDDNPILEELVKLMIRTQYKGESVRLARYNAKGLVPEKHEFWTYEGSLTTPPASECVVWTVFRPAIPISSRQLDVFRSLFAVPAEDAERNPAHLVNNVRPVQPVNNRLVRSSFRSGGIIQS